jgi:hypothetical protein
MRRGALNVFLFGAAALGGCSEGVLAPHGPIGKAEAVILYDATGIMLAVIIPVILLTLTFAWWFRAGNTRARYLPNWEYSGRIEMITWSIPALVILFLGGIAWIGSHDLDPPQPIESATTPLDVEVISLDWKWLFIYPNQGIASVNRLVVRHELVLCARARQPDLHNAGHDHAAQPASRPGRRLQGFLGAIQRGWFLRHALRGGRARCGSVRRLG